MHDGSLHGSGALRSKLLQGGRAAASAPGGAVAHEAGEHASIVVDNKLHVAARANVSEQAVDLCVRLATSTSRHMADCTAGQNKGQDATGPASTQSWQRLRRAAGVEVTLGKHPRRVRGRRPAEEAWQDSDDTAQSRFDRRHSCSQQGM